jgi:chromosomal replication initiation ATPase DnaA
VKSHACRPDCPSCEAAGGLTNALDRAADEVTADRIIDAAAQAHGWTRADLLGPWRSPSVVWARHLAMYLVRSRTSLSLPAIGRLFGDRHHTTILNAVRNIADRVIDEDAGTRAAIARIDAVLKP